MTQDLSTAELTEQVAELLPARTVLSTFGPGLLSDSDDGDGGDGGDGTNFGNVNALGDQDNDADGGDGGDGDD